MDQNGYTQYLAPPQYTSPTAVPEPPITPSDQSDSESPGKLDVRLSGHARAVSLPASVVMQATPSNSTEGQANGHYEVEPRMYGLGLDATE